MAKVSICLPTYNRCNFIHERIESITAQSFQDWEVIAADSSSNDGTFEVLQAWANRDSRVKLYTIPREGIYPAFNFCINSARGDFVYIAPSDDTMDVTLLEKLTIALDNNRNCDISHAPLQAIDVSGNIIGGGNWMSPLPGTFTNCLEREHTRLAPLDGMLHLFSSSVYISLTQLLFRKHLFSEFGLFSTDYASFGDFHWLLKATLRKNTVHVPGTWGGFRMHAEQATTEALKDPSIAKARVDSIVDDVMQDLNNDPSMAMIFEVAQDVRAEIDRKRRFQFRLQSADHPLGKALLLLKELVYCNQEAFEYLASKLTRSGYYSNRRANAVLRFVNHRLGSEHIIIR